MEAMYVREGRVRQAANGSKEGRFPEGAHLEAALRPHDSGVVPFQSSALDRPPTSRASVRGGRRVAHLQRGTRLNSRVAPSAAHQASNAVFGTPLKRSAS